MEGNNSAALEFRDALVESGHRFRQDFITMPQAVLEDSLKFMTKLTGIHGKETVGKIKSDAQWKPYQIGTYNASNTTSMHPRTIETYHLELIEEFDPATVYKTVYGKVLRKDRTSLEVVRAAVAEMARAASGKLVQTLWTGVRDEDGTTSLDNFDGFDTIIKKEKAAGNISKTLGNYFQAGKLTEYNIGDKLMLIWSLMPQLLTERQNVYLYMPANLQQMYERWYNNNYGNANYTNQFNQSVLVGTNNHCFIASMMGMDDVQHIFFTTKDNLVVGFDGESGTESFDIRVPNNPKMVQIFGEMFMGCQITNLEKECFFCSSFTYQFDTPYISYDPESVEFDNVAAGESATENVHVEGVSLTADLTVAVTGNGFTSTTTSITAAAAKAGVDIPVKFAPSSAGDYSGKLTITSSTDIVEVEIPLKGTAS